MASLSPVLSQRKNMAVIRLTTEDELAWWPPILMFSEPARRLFA